MNKQTTLSLFLSLVVMLSATAVENRRPQLADDIETPDTLLQSTTPSERKKVYGDEGIGVQSEGRRDNSIITPDALERSLQTRVKDVSKKKRDKQAKKVKEKKFKRVKKESIMTDDQETPDPMFEDLN